MRRIAIGLALSVLAIAPIARVHAARSASLVPPDDDSFYGAPSPLPSGPPGTIVRSRPVSLSALSIPVPFKAWQVMYLTTDVAGRPSAAVATIIKPLASTGALRLLSYQEPWDSDSLRCSPSYQLRQGIDANAFAIFPALTAGWTVVDTDFEGLQAAFSAGRQAARGVLDGIRAAEDFGPAHLPGRSTPVGLWGYSGGGQATAWATEMAPSYAPDLRLVGAAEGGVPANVDEIARHVDGGPASGLELAASVGLSRAYPQLIALWNAAGKRMAAAMATECIGQYVFQFSFQRLDRYTTIPHPIDVPWVHAIVEQQNLGQLRPATPLYIYHSVNDELIPVAVADALVASYCRQGVAVDYYRDLLSEHITLAGTGGPAAFAYLAGRFAGQPAPTTCRSVVVP